MTDHDERVRRALSAPDEAFLRDVEDGRGLFTQMSALFHGPLRFWSLFGAVWVFVATGVGLWAVWNLLHADTTRALVLWAGAAWAAWTVQIALKQWAYDRMNTLTILRELKKIELRLARLEDTR